MRKHEKHWAMRVVAGIAFFTAIICASAPVQAAADRTQAATTCMVLAQNVKSPKDVERHALLAKHHAVVEDASIAFYLGWATGYLERKGIVDGTAANKVFMLAAYDQLCLSKT